MKAGAKAGRWEGAVVARLVAGIAAWLMAAASVHAQASPQTGTRPDYCTGIRTANMPDGEKIVGGKRALIKRWPGFVALRLHLLHELLERHVLMRVCAEAGLVEWKKHTKVS